MFALKGEGFSCSLDVLYGSLDPYPYTDSLEMMDPDPFPDPQQCIRGWIIKMSDIPG
jgi:hypothetical protein